MPVYTFALRDGSVPIEDNTGVSLPDSHHALDYAHRIIRELMHGCEAQTRSWRLDVYENGSGLLFKIPFAGLDRTLDHLSAPARASLERLYESYRSLQEAICAAQTTARESRALVALSRGQPYLIAHSGERTIRAG